jgi:hypothetical protein
MQKRGFIWREYQHQGLHIKEAQSLAHRDATVRLIFAQGMRPLAPGLAIGGYSRSLPRGFYAWR